MTKRESIVDKDERTRTPTSIATASTTTASSSGSSSSYLFRVLLIPLLKAVMRWLRNLTVAVGATSILLSVVVVARRPSSSSSSSSSLLAVDPRGFLRVLTKHGGPLLPRPVEHDLGVLSRVCDCDSSVVDVVRRELVLRNLTVSTTTTTTRDQEEDAALRVGRVRVTWGSYSRPRIAVELEDVDVSVVFANLLLTRTNWHELANVGFPPTMYMTSPSSSSSNDDSFLRVSDVDLRGTVRLFVRSRPLGGRSILLDGHDESVLLRLDEDLSGLVETVRAAVAASAEGGLTTRELADVLSRFVTERVRESIASWAWSAATTGDVETPVRGARDLLARARDRVASYAGVAVDEGLWGRDGLLGRRLDESSAETLRSVGRAAYERATAAIRAASEEEEASSATSRDDDEDDDDDRKRDDAATSDVDETCVDPRDENAF